MPIRPVDGPPRWTFAAAGTSSTSAPRTPIHRQGRRGRRSSAYITVPYLAVEAPTLTVDQPAEGATFENGAIPSRVTRPTRRRSSSARCTPVRRRPRRPGLRDRDAPRRRRTGAGHRAGRARWLVHRRRSISPPGQVGDHGHRVERRGQDDLADPQRDGRLQGRQPRGVDQGRPGVAQGLGGRQDRSTSARPARSSATARSSPSGARNRSRSGRARRA